MEGKNVVKMNTSMMQGVNISEMYTNGFLTRSNEQDTKQKYTFLGQSAKQIRSVQPNQIN